MAGLEEIGIREGGKIRNMDEPTLGRAIRETEQGGMEGTLTYYKLNI